MIEKTAKVKYTTPWEIPQDEFPYWTDAGWVLRLCDKCFANHIHEYNYRKNELFPEQGYMCVGCGWISSGPLGNAFDRATEAIEEAIDCGASEAEIAELFTAADGYMLWTSGRLNPRRSTWKRRFIYRLKLIRRMVFSRHY